MIKTQIIISITLLTLWSKQCFSQYGSFIYKSPNNAISFINDFEIDKDNSIFFTLNRSCILKECQEIVKVKNLKTFGFTTIKSPTFDPLLINKDILLSYTTLKNENIDSNYWNIDYYSNDLKLIKTLSWKSPSISRVVNYGIYPYKNNYLLYGTGYPDKYPNQNISPAIMIIGHEGEKIMPMTFFVYDTLNPEIHGLEGVYMQHDTAFYFSYQIAKQPHQGSYFYKLNAKGEQELKWYLKLYNTRPIKFFVDDDNNLISFTTATMNKKTVAVIKVDKAGNQLWKTSLPEQFSGQDHIGVGDIVPCKNGDILIATLAELFDTLSTGEVYQNPMIYLARLTKDGKLKWFRRLSQRSTDGKWKNSSPNKTIEADNGDILIGGALSREEAIGGYDAWFMRLSANGCLTNECKDEYVTEIGGEIITTTKDIENTMSKAEVLNAFPNPTNDKITIELPSLNIKLYHYDIFNAQGQKLEQSSKSLQNEKLDLDLSRYQSGLYHILIKGDKEVKIYMSTVVKL